MHCIMASMEHLDTFHLVYIIHGSHIYVDNIANMILVVDYVFQTRDQEKKSFHWLTVTFTSRLTNGMASFHGHVFG